MTTFKFNPGDLILCNKSSGGGGYIKGNYYTVKSSRINEFFGRLQEIVSTELDENGSTSNGWGTQFFDHVDFEYTPTQEGDREDDI